MPEPPSLAPAQAFGEYSISTDKQLMDVALIHNPDPYAG